MYLVCLGRYLEKPFKGLKETDGGKSDMTRPQIPEQLIDEVKQIHERQHGYSAGVFQEALRTVTDLAKTSFETEQTTPENSFSQKEEERDLVKEMYNGVAAVEEGSSLYLLDRDSPFLVEYVDRQGSINGEGVARVYLEGPQGGKYRLVADCDTESLYIENKSSGEWKTHSTRVKTFRYRSPSHPDSGANWEYSP